MALPLARRSGEPELEALERAGRDLVAIAVRGEPLDRVVPLARSLQPALLAIARRRLAEKALPLPELLVVGHALELAILECVRRPSPRRFAERFEEQLDVVFEYCRLTGAYVDRWRLGESGLGVRQQARAAALVEAALALPLEERRRVCAYVSERADPRRTAAELGVRVSDVRASIARVLRAARARTEAWLEEWSAPRRPRPRRR